MSTSKRPLLADFETHAGDDTGFKNELIILMIANVLELKRTVDVPIGTFDELLFASVCHKVTTTIFLLSDNEFTGMVDAIRRTGESSGKVVLFNSLCSQVIASLQAALSIPDAAVVYP